MLYVIDVTPYPTGASLNGFPKKIEAADEEAAIARLEREVANIEPSNLTGDDLAVLYVKTDKGETRLTTRPLGRR
jgi:hypothetical protein